MTKIRKAEENLNRRKQRKQKRPELAKPQTTCPAHDPPSKLAAHAPSPTLCFLCFLLFKFSSLASVTVFKGFVRSGVRREEVDLVSRQGDFRRITRLLQIRYAFWSNNWKDRKRLP